MTPKQISAIAEDLRKIGTTTMAAGLIGIVVSDQHLLTGCAFAIGTVTWFCGIHLTRKDDSEGPTP